MRLWHLAFGVFVVALMLTIARDPAGRVGVIVFIVGLGEAISGTTAILALFRTIGAIGEAHGLQAHAEAVAATTVVLVVASTVMASLFFAGAWLVRATMV